jgi:hypothetical protein
MTRVDPAYMIFETETVAPQAPVEGRILRPATAR